MVLAYHGVNLPVANTSFFGNDGGAFVNMTRFLIWPRLSWIHISFYVSCGIAVNAYTSSAITFVCPDMLVDAFMADQDAQLIFELSWHCSGSNPVEFWLQSAHQVGVIFRLLRLFYDYPLWFALFRTITFLALIPCQFPGNRHSDTPSNAAISFWFFPLSLKFQSVSCWPCLAYTLLMCFLVFGRIEKAWTIAAGLLFPQFSCTYEVECKIILHSQMKL